MTRPRRLPTVRTRTASTLLVTKTAARLSRLLGRGGGHSLPGLIAERLDPRLAQRLASQLPHGVILVTGTNGKTTTTKLIAAALAANGERVLTNSTGSNLKRGVTAALISAASLGGRIDATVGLFEVDEANLRLVAPALQPRHILVLNLFRDQLDRYGELDTTAALIGEGITATQAQVYLNADDPLVASLSRYADPARVSYFGVADLPTPATAQRTATDSDRCPVCHQRLVFTRVFYSHIGHYRCDREHFTRPEPRLAITHVARADLHGSRFTVAVDGVSSELTFPLPGTYNLYNALATMSVAHGFGLAPPRIAATLEAAEAAFGRVESVTLQGRRLYLLLIKNPAGFTQVLETFLIGRPDLRVLLAINDLDADGRDVSWLWDVPIEALAPSKPTVFVAGTRQADMALRLRYAGMDARLTNGLEAAVSDLLQATPEGETAYVLPTYTAMLGIRKVLARQVSLPEVWT